MRQPDQVHEESLDRASLEQHRRFGYRPQLDGVRALAILPVVAFHAWGTPDGGFFGVDVFFVLSGFLITTLLVEERQGTGWISLPHFYLRRALRLLPALIVAVAAYLLVVATVAKDPPPSSRALEGALYGVLYVSNIMIATGTLIPVAIGHLWSLATEEQFYLLWPLALFLALRLGASRRWLSSGLTLAIVALLANRLELIDRGASFRRVYFSPDGHFDVILIGCLAGLWFATDTIPALFKSPLFRGVATPVASAAVVAMFVLPSFAGWHVYLGLLPLFAVAIALLILVVVVDEQSPLASLLRLPPLVFVGKISYALYLWHPILLYGFARLPRVAEVALSFVAATLSYYVIELPFLRRKRRDRARIDAGAAANRPAELPAGAPSR